MCTNITIKAKDESVIVGHSMENAIFMYSEVFFRSKDYHYVQNLDQKNLAYRAGEDIDIKLKPINEKLLLKWNGEYAFVAMNALNTEMVAHGMNSKGLVVCDMTLCGSQYQEIDESKKNALSYPYLTTWILSTCATCDDVRERLPEVNVFDPFDNIDPGFYFHFPVNDPTGDAIVIEYTNGKLNIYDNSELGVLTNDPVFPWQAENLKNYVNIRPANIPVDESGNRFSVSYSAQGTGFIGLPGSSTPTDRFVRAAMMTNYAYNANSKDEAISLAVHVMNTVDIPRGTSRVDKDSTATMERSDFTQWITISDTKNLKYYIRSYATPQVYEVDFKSILDKLVKDQSMLNSLKISIPTDHMALNLLDFIDSDLLTAPVLQ